MKLTWIPVCCAVYCRTGVCRRDRLDCLWHKLAGDAGFWLDQHHPEIQAMQRSRLPPMARVYPAGALPDPMFPDGITRTLTAVIRRWRRTRSDQPSTVLFRACPGGASAICSGVSPNRKPSGWGLRLLRRATTAGATESGLCTVFYSHTAARVNQELAEIARATGAEWRKRATPMAWPRSRCAQAQLEKPRSAPDDCLP